MLREMNIQGRRRGNLRAVEKFGFTGGSGDCEFEKLTAKIEINRTKERSNKQKTLERSDGNEYN
jgi:hypothetical protein